MPSIKDQSTVNEIARVFCGQGKRNKSETLRTVGYKDSYCDTKGIGVVYGNVRVIAAIKAIDAKISKGIDHNRTIAIDLLVSDFAKLNAKANAGDIQAIQARTSIVRELNAISALHTQTVVTEDKTQPLSAEDKAKLRREAIALTG